MEKLKLLLFMSDVPSPGDKPRLVGSDPLGNKYYQVKGPGVIHCTLVFI